MRKIVRVSTRATESNTIGRAREHSFQIIKRQQELRRDVEAIALTAQASVAGTDTVAGRAGGFGAWLTTSYYAGAGGSSTGFANGIVAAPTIGTSRALTEALVRDAAQSVYDQGGDATMMMSVPSIKRKWSEYLFSSSARIATLYSDVQQTRGQVTASGASDVFVSDFGTLTIVANRLQQTYDNSGTDNAYVYIYDPQYVNLCYLHGYRTEPLAKVGLSDQSQMCVDWTLVVNTEKAHAVIADINPALDVTDT